MMNLAVHEDSVEAVLLDDHVRLMNEATATLSESELRHLIVEIAQEVESFYEFKSSIDKESTTEFNLPDFVDMSMEQSRRSALI